MSLLRRATKTTTLIHPLTSNTHLEDPQGPPQQYHYGGGQSSCVWSANKAIVWP